MLWNLLGICLHNLIFDADGNRNWIHGCLHSNSEITSSVSDMRPSWKVVCAMFIVQRGLRSFLNFPEKRIYLFAIRILVIQLKMSFLPSLIGTITTRNKYTKLHCQRLRAPIIFLRETIITNNLDPDATLEEKWNLFCIDPAKCNNFSTLPSVHVREFWGQ